MDNNNKNNNDTIPAPSTLTERPEPPIGSWAHVARIMAEEFPDEDVDWDSWKDEMKERDME